MADFSKAFSPSFNAKTFTTKEIPGINYKAASNFNLSNINFNKLSSISFNPIAFDKNLNFLGGSSPSWTFITAPEDVSWDIANQSDRVNMFGTNNPPVVAGTKGMRDLRLGNSLVEGFIRGVTVEDKVAALENLLRYNETLSDGFVSVPVYQVWASAKSYGGSNAYFIIKDVSVREKMRDLKGNSTRAYVDISFMEVPAYQVNTGRDQASASTAGAKSSLISEAQARNVVSTSSDTAAKASVDKNIPGKKTGSTGPRPGNQPRASSVPGVDPAKRIKINPSTP